MKMKLMKIRMKKQIIKKVKQNYIKLKVLSALFIYVTILD